VTSTAATCVPPMVMVYWATACSGAAAAGRASRPTPNSRAPRGFRITALNTGRLPPARGRLSNHVDRETCLRGPRHARRSRASQLDAAGRFLYGGAHNQEQNPRLEAGLPATKAFV